MNFLSVTESGKNMGKRRRVTTTRRRFPFVSNHPRLASRNERKRIKRWQSLLLTNPIIELPDSLKVCAPVLDRQGIPDDIVIPLRRVIPKPPVDDGDNAGIRLITDQAANALLEVDDHLRHVDLHQGIIRNRHLIVNDRIGHRKG